MKKKKKKTIYQPSLHRPRNKNEGREKRRMEETEREKKKQKKKEWLIASEKIAFVLIATRRYYQGYWSQVADLSRYGAERERQGLACREGQRGEQVERGLRGERGCIEAWRTQAERVGKGSSKLGLERRRTWPGKSIERRERGGSRVRAAGKWRRKSFGYKITPVNLGLRQQLVWLRPVTGRCCRSAGKQAYPATRSENALEPAADCKNDDKIARLIPLLDGRQLLRGVDVVVIKSSRTMRHLASSSEDLLPLPQFR